MPTYEYQCKLCNNRFERFQKMTDAHIAGIDDLQKKKDGELLKIPQYTLS